MKLRIRKNPTAGTSILQGSPAGLPGQSLYMQVHFTRDHSFYIRIIPSPWRNHPFWLQGSLNSLMKQKLREKRKWFCRRIKAGIKNIESPAEFNQHFHRGNKNSYDEDACPDSLYNTGLYLSIKSIWSSLSVGCRHRGFACVGCCHNWIADESYPLAVWWPGRRVDSSLPSI